MYLNNQYYPLGQFVLYPCLIMILYLNLRKNGWLFKYSELLSYLVIVIGITLSAIDFEQLKDIKYWLSYLNILIVTFVLINKNGKEFAQKIRSTMWGKISCFILIIVVFSFSYKHGYWISVVVTGLFIISFLVFYLQKSIYKKSHEQNSE